MRLNLNSAIDAISKKILAVGFIIKSSLNISKSTLILEFKLSGNYVLFAYYVKIMRGGCFFPIGWVYEWTPNNRWLHILSKFRFKASVTKAWDKSRHSEVSYSLRRNGKQKSRTPHLHDRKQSREYISATNQRYYYM